ncbi:hypothetical protein GCM10009804_18860 [Kribbella hippodromi]|uniref:Uncharacterized protein n=1 Tax=Kribbella hippodromi TaxID=434347 RepID=A0ABN2CS16_9ACTN
MHSPNRFGAANRPLQGYNPPRSTHTTTPKPVWGAQHPASTKPVGTTPDTELSWSGWSAQLQADYWTVMLP